MGVHVDEAGRNGEPVGIDHPRSVQTGQVPDLRDAISLHANVRTEPGVARSIDHTTVLEKDVEHDYLATIRDIDRATMVHDVSSGGLPRRNRDRHNWRLRAGPRRRKTQWGRAPPVVQLGSDTGSSSFAAQTAS